MIGELARQAGMTVQTVRFYERRKLLPEPTRTESGYRQYRSHELSRLAFIRQVKAFGFSLTTTADAKISFCVDAFSNSSQSRSCSSALAVMYPSYSTLGTTHSRPAMTSNQLLSFL